LRESVERSLAAAVKTYEQMRKRGIRVVIGGDYGFDITPQGANARDLEHFVKLFGYSPSEALACATRIGAEVMEMGDELGQVREAISPTCCLSMATRLRTCRFCSGRNDSWPSCRTATFTSSIAKRSRATKAARPKGGGRLVR
jgi:hypothetical protein